MAASPALAGDGALFSPPGFSSDGRYFAFEEYGVFGFEGPDRRFIAVPIDQPAGEP